MRNALLALSLVLAAATSAARLAAADPGGGDWPMWGGTPDRNMVSNMKGLPIDWDVKTKKNVKWVAELGSQTYGNMVVANGVVLVGTNNESPRDPKQAGDRGVLMAFSEATGEFLWQQTHEKLSSGRANDWPYQGVASSPLVENGRVYYVSNRGVLWCLDIKGFSDGNAGPVTDEKLTGPKDADVIWSFDMMEEVGSYPHNMSNSSPVVWGDLVYVSTSNGQDESHVHIPSPKAPTIIGVNKNTGKLVWEDNSVGDKILHGQWSTPSVGKIGGVDQVVSAQGDGWVRGYETAHRQEALGVRHEPEGFGVAENAERDDWDAGRLRGPGLHRQRPGSRARRGRRAPVRDRRDQARRHHADRPRVALRQDPPLDLDRIDCRRAALHRGLQRLSPLPRCEDRPGVLDARHLRGRVGIDAGRRRPRVPGRRRRRRGRPAGGQGKEGARRDEHGQRRIRDARARQRRALHQQPQSALQAGRDGGGK